jgi:ribosomal protein S6
MPLYHILTTVKPATPHPILTELVAKCGSNILGAGGVVRGVQNHGIRELPHLFKAKNADVNGVRYFRDGRFVSLYFDVGGQEMSKIERNLRNDDCVLRFTTMKPADPCAKAAVAKTKKNAYYNRALGIGSEIEERAKTFLEALERDGPDFDATGINMKVNKDEIFFKDLRQKLHDNLPKK